VRGADEQLRVLGMEKIDGTKGIGIVLDTARQTEEVFLDEAKPVCNTGSYS
jgi:hypothetical protein